LARRTAKQKKRALRWAIMVTFWTFLVAFVFALTMRFILHGIQSIIISFLLLLFIIFIGVLFDTIGTAVTAANETPFHSKASKKVYGAQKGIYLVRYADQVANFCNDMIGDISGVVSGVVGAVIIFNLVLARPELSEIYLSIILTAVVAALTVGGKALGKYLAISRPTEVVLLFAQVLTTIEKVSLRKKQNRY